MEERERVTATVCVCVSYVRTHVHVCTHTYALITLARDTHTHTPNHTRESSSMCRMSIRPKEGRAKGEKDERRMARGRKVRGWTVSREVTRECRAVERVCGLCASCE